MSREITTIDYDYFNSNDESFEDLKQAVQSLTTASEAQFQEIKKEKWYNRLFDMLTFSQKGKKRMAEQISSIAQAQQILMEILVRLSNTDERVAALVNKSMDSIRELQKNDIYLLSYIKELENTCILGIRKSSDITDLSDKNKQILSGCLYFLTNSYDEVSDGQKQYANALLNYLGTNSEVENLSAALSTMDEASRKKVLTCCMEYIFLNEYDDEIPENLEDFIDEFDFGNKTIKEIKRQITATFKLRGESGFIDKYALGNYQNISEEFYVDLEDAFVESDFEDNSTASIENSEEKELLILDESFDPGMDDEIEFINKEIYVDDEIEFDGKFTFINCRIHYGNSEHEGKIRLTNMGELELRNCFIDKEENSEEVFISAEENNIITIDRCEFNDCTVFINATNLNKLDISNSKLINCNSRFIEADTTNDNTDSGINICNNYFEFNKDRKFICAEEKNDFGVSRVFGNSKQITLILANPNVLFKNNTVFQSDPNDRIRIATIKQSHYGIVSGRIEDCYFEGLRLPIEAKEISTCRFKNCASAVYIPTAGFVSRECVNGLIENCLFEDQSSPKEPAFTLALFNEYPYLISISDGNIQNCTFLNCNCGLMKSSGSHGYNVDNCNFYNIMSQITPITYTRGFKDHAKGTLSNSNFDGIKVENYLISTDCTEEVSSILAISNCHFNNCRTKRKDKQIINEKAHYYGGVFGNTEKYFYSVYIDEKTTGLDKVNSVRGGASQEAINSIHKKWENIKIGCDLSKNVSPDEFEIPNTNTDVEPEKEDFTAKNSSNIVNKAGTIAGVVGVTAATAALGPMAPLVGGSLGATISTANATKKVSPSNLGIIMIVESVYTVAGRGIVADGHIQTKISVGNKIKVNGKTGQISGIVNSQGMTDSAYPKRM